MRPGSEETVNEFARGVRLGVDVGQVRVGVSVSDPSGILATPLVTLARDLTSSDDQVPTDLAELRRLVAEHEAVEVVVGLPVNLAGKHGPAAVHATSYANRLADVIA